MKKTTFLFILLFSLTSCNENLGIDNTENLPISKSVLFIGNSYTNYNDMPQQVKEMANSVNDELILGLHVPSGTRISDHNESMELEEKIDSRKWDYVTIQTQSSESALSQDHFDNNVYPHVLSIVNKIKSNYLNSSALFYMTWGYENGEFPSLCVNLPYLCEFEGMNDKLTERYTFMAQSTNSVLSPVGIVWKNIRNSHPEIDLYRADESHPSHNGSFLAACTFYTVIFEKDPTLLLYNNPEVDDTIETIIKNEVKRTVFNNLNNWYYN